MNDAGVDFKVKTIRVDERNVAVQLWDTAGKNLPLFHPASVSFGIITFCKRIGQERFRSITQSYFRKADGVMLLFDVTSERSFLNIRHWADCLSDCLSRQQLDLPLVLVGTKSDLRPASQHQGLSCVGTVQAQRLAAQLKAQYIETSAKTGHNLLEALVVLTRSVLSSLQFRMLIFFSTPPRHL